MKFINNHTVANCKVSSFGAILIFKMATTVYFGERKLKHYSKRIIQRDTNKPTKDTQGTKPT